MSEIWTAVDTEEANWTQVLKQNKGGKESTKAKYQYYWYQSWYW